MREPALQESIHTYLHRHQHKELLRFLTCGSVDDGKSTLIGRLLHDTKGIYEDQLAAIKKDSVKHGTTGAGQIDLALLTDGLRAEREQGITIDVAYRYFSTDKRKFIIADTPGHEQYTRNMATGASTCQLAILLIDARHGVMTQTRRHSFICRLLGIRHLVVAINKMDLVDYSRERYEEIQKDYLAFAAALGIKPASLVFIPLSALVGDNVVEPSANMPWYTQSGGPTLLAHLETVEITGDRNLADLRFPVQLVLRPNLDFRGFAGTIASGVLRRGDLVRALPSGKTSRIKSITTYEGELQEAFAPMSIAVTLEDEIDISRGDMLVNVTEERSKEQEAGSKKGEDAAANRKSKIESRKSPLVASDLDAMVVWMHEQPLVPGKTYWIKQTTRQISGAMVELTHGVDVNTLEHRPASRLGLNEVGQVVLALSQPLVFDPYTRNPATGAFIIIDRLSNTTVGAGMILGRHADGTNARGRVTQGEKEIRLGQAGSAVWVDRHLADALERELFEEARTIVRLDTADLFPVAGGGAAKSQEPGLSPQQAAMLAPYLRALTEQAIIALVSSDAPPPPALAQALAGRLIVCAQTSLEKAMSQLREHGLGGVEESIAGEGI